MRTPVSVGVVGLGSQGLALARMLDELPGAELRWVADQSPAAALHARGHIPSASVGRELDDLLADEALDAIVVATPPATRYGLVRRALDAGRHVLADSPLALKGLHGEDLARRADAGDRRLETRDALLFQPGFTELRERVHGGALGDLYYVTVARQGLASTAGREGVLWGEGALAVAMALAVVGDEPIEVTAHGGVCDGAGPVDLAFCHLRFATGVETQITLSAMEPQPSRRLTAVGARGMAVFDELDGQRPLTVAVSGESGGDLVSPRLQPVDALRARCEDFLSAVRQQQTAVERGAREAAAVVVVLEALQRSLDRGGVAESIGVSAEPVHERGGALAGVIPLPVRSA